VICPKCGREVPFFIRRKVRDPFLKCPACNQLFYKSAIPEGVSYEVKYEEEAKALLQAKREVGPGLFEEPKEPTEVISEILLDWGCDEHFVRKIAEYIEAKGFFDPAWLAGMLMQARTGRRFTPQEANMVVDMINAALERERRKAEEAGRMFPLMIVPLRPPAPTGYVGGAQPLHPTYAPGYYYPPSTYSPVAPPPSTTAPPQPPSTTYYAPPVQLTPQTVQEMIRQAFAEYKRTSEIDELKKTIVELEKKRLEDRAEFERRLAEGLQQIREAISSQPQAPPPPVVDKKDIELMAANLEKAFSQRISELEKRYVEAKSEAEKKELMGRIEGLRAELEAAKKEWGRPPVSPQGWQKDETRLVAELGTRALDIIRERKPIETIVRIIPVQPQQPQQQQQKTEKSLVDLIKEEGGTVE
jgi:hypothetical protein